LPGYFLTQGIGVRALGMGRAYVAVADDASAVFWNPSALAQINRNEVSAGHIQLFEDSQYSFLVFADQIKTRLYWGAAFTQLAGKGIEERDRNNIFSGKLLNDYHNAYFLSGSYAIKHNFSAGVALKIVETVFDDIKSAAAGADLSFLYSFNKKLRLGLNIQNAVSPQLDRSSGIYDYPLIFRSGLACKINSFLLSLDLDKTVGRNINVFLGAEYDKTFFQIRAGLDDFRPAAGIGFDYKSFALDYGVFKHYLGYSHKAAVSYLYSKTKKLSVSKGYMYTRNIIDKIKIDYRAAASIPCSIYELLPDKGFSLLQLNIENLSEKEVHIKIKTKLLGFSEEIEKTVKINPGKRESLSFYPIVSPQKINEIEVHTPAAFSVEVYIQHSNKEHLLKKETVKTILEPYDQFCISKEDACGKIHDLTETIAAWVTFNDRCLNDILSKAAAEGVRKDPPIRLIGEQPPYIFSHYIQDNRNLKEKDRDCMRQIRQVYETLQNEYDIMYLNQPAYYMSGQRVKYPRETLNFKGNCIELSVLFASLIESMEFDPLLFLFPEEGHAAVGWKVTKENRTAYHLIEPNLFGDDFDRLLEKGKELVEEYGLGELFNNGIQFDDSGIYKRNFDYIILDIKKIRQKIPPSPYVPKK